MLNEVQLSVQCCIAYIFLEVCSVEIELVLLKADPFDGK